MMNYLDMIRDLEWTSEEACEKLHCTMEEFSNNDVMKMPVYSVYKLVKEYNKTFKPAKKISIGDVR